jgi:cysteine sulfinate desulfinase/cysteine desulfurase-like protein
VLAEDILAAIRPNTVLVTVMCINNETGADNRSAIVSIGRGLQTIKNSRKLPILFHSDAVQAFGKYQVPFEEARLDMVTVSFYKIFGPNRIGALATRQGALDIIKAHPLINTSLLDTDSTHGGTQSMALVAAALNSLKVVSINRPNKNKRLASMRIHLDTALHRHFQVIDYCDLKDNPDSIGKEWLLVSFSPL